jgi:hypothetical protein
VCLFPKTIEATVEAGRIENHISRTLFISSIFFSSNFSISLYYFLYAFIFFVRSIRIIAKNPLILFNLLCLSRKKLLFLCFCICCSNNPSWFIFCLSNFFPYPIFFFFCLSNFFPYPVFFFHVQTSSQKKPTKFITSKP